MVLTKTSYDFYNPRTRSSYNSRFIQEIPQHRIYMNRACETVCDGPQLLGKIFLNIKFRVFDKILNFWEN